MAKGKGNWGKWENNERVGKIKIARWAERIIREIAKRVGGEA